MFDGFSSLDTTALISIFFIVVHDVMTGRKVVLTCLICGVREKDRDRGFLMMENDDGQMWSKIFVLIFSFDVFAAD